MGLVLLGPLGVMLRDDGGGVQPVPVVEVVVIVPACHSTTSVAGASPQHMRTRRHRCPNRMERRESAGGL